MEIPATTHPLAQRTRPPLRLAETHAQVLQQAIGLSGAPSALALVRLSRLVRRQAATAALHGSSLRMLFRQLRQLFTTALGGPNGDQPAAGPAVVALRVAEAAVNGYLQAGGSQTAPVREHALQVLEEERQRLARELHDEIGQILTAALFQIDTTLADHPDAPTGLRRALHEVRQLLVGVSRDLHRLVYDLRPPLLHALGLVPTLEAYLRRFGEHYRLTTELVAPPDCRLPEAVETALFRIAQEALTNIARHAAAHTVRIELQVTPRRVVLTIQDDGQGFNPRTLARTPGRALGLLGMRERARQLGGTLSICSAPGAGTTVRVSLPRSGRRSTLAPKGDL